MRLDSACFAMAALFLAPVAGCGGEEGPPDREPAVRTEREPARAAEPPWFSDEAAQRGITLLNQTGRPHKKELIMGAVGPGAAVFDANGDGLLDIYIPNGNWLHGDKRDQFYMGEDRPRNALYIQQPGGTFRNEAKKRGVDDDAWGFGACAADLDDDGDQDLIVANLGVNRLYRNDGKGFFRDVAREAGIAGPSERGTWEWSTGIAIGDYDRDGLLDIYVANYADLFKWMRESPDVKRSRDGRILKANVCKWQRLEVYCGPKGLPGQQDHLYRGVRTKDRSLKYEDVTKKSGIWRAGEGESGVPLYGFQPLLTDLNADGWLDIYVANDSVPSFFFENQRDGTFQERGHDYGIAVGDGGDDMAGMGADSADINGDGLLDVHKTNFALQTNNLYVAERGETGDVTFRDFSTWAGVQENVYTDLGWAVLVFDYDHDGRRDIFYANGHVYPEVDLPRAKGLNTTFEQYNQMLRNVSEGVEKIKLTPVTKRMGPGFDIKKCSRGAALIDFDDDGDLDIVVVNLNNTPDFLVNLRGSRSGHWLGLKLKGDPARKVNRDAIGCKVLVRAGGRTQFFETKRGQGFLGCHDPRVHVGLGDHAGPVEVEVTWPNGEKTTHAIDEVDRYVEIALGAMAR